MHLRFHIKPALDLICDMRNDLHRSAAVIAPALFIQNGPVYFARRYIGIVVQTLVDKALVVAKVQVCLRPVIGHKDFPVLDGVHGAGVHIEIRVKLLHGHFIAARLEEPPQRRRRDPFAEAGDDASGHKYVFCHLSLLVVCHGSVATGAVLGVALGIEDHSPVYVPHGFCDF